MRTWHGINTRVGISVDTTDKLPVGLELSRDLAGELANLLRKATTLGEPPASLRITELLNALDYVLVGDPASVAAHRRLEASKGMEPAGADSRSYASAGEITRELTRPEPWRVRGFDSKAQMQEFEARPGFPGWEAL